MNIVCVMSSYHEYCWVVVNVIIHCGGAPEYCYVIFLGSVFSCSPLLCCCEPGGGPGWVGMVGD